MHILTFDTALNSMYITLSNNNNIICSKIIETTEDKYHSAFLIPMIVEILQKNKMSMQDINALGVNIGPGSFTGIRAGLTVAKVMGQALNIPVVGISSLQILSLINKSDKNTLCLMDARKNKAYTGIFEPDGKTIQQPYALEYEKAFELAKEQDFYVISDDRMAKMLTEQDIVYDNFFEKNYDLGINLAKLTQKALNTDLNQYNYTNLKPLYIQPPPISMPKIAK
ncbi:MAG: tRNA (adenosine(37)-N6)-threonylcarbamoyltransferase complex dimerization subunit type 1 TsaB [Candidatus Gastranaerophilales bacterium]|nr:tRNA (adenosine(37)-N6)-threonylcarbamoyltransferase complex dimerization subunit type 1 TsaB [Candidatus Gastranaerophilales bacterium]